MKPSDADFLQELKRERGTEIAERLEATRLATAKGLAKDRATLLADFDREFPKLERDEEEKLAAFHELSKKLEHAREEVQAAHWARTSAQAEIGKRVASINGKIIAARNPLAAKLLSELDAIAEGARKIPLALEERDETPPTSVTIMRSRKDIKTFSNCAARCARMFFPARIMNALGEVVLSGREVGRELTSRVRRGYRRAASAGGA